MELAACCSWLLAVIHFPVALFALGLLVPADCVVNDNFDQWNMGFSEWNMGFSELVDWASRDGSRASLLEKLDVKQLAIVGVAGDSCVLSSALDAHIREFPAWVPADASASLTRSRRDRVIQFLAESPGCDITAVDCLQDEI